MNDNRVTLYSNGIADFQRCYSIPHNQVQKVSIPVRSDHLADVLGSFNVYGEVTLESPPTFRLSNELEGNLSINPASVLEDLATSLSGARVRIHRAGKTLEGKLVGIHREEEGTAGKAIHPPSLVVLNENGLSRSPIREIQSFQFLDKDVQAEIEKGLQRNYQRIKPNSTFVDLELSATEENSEAIVQYTIPVAAWKISYRLHLAGDMPAKLQGLAIVDNNTDEDWNNFRVCVVTGEPITFSTDLADTKTPERKHVNLVRDKAIGAVEVEEAAYIMEEAGSPMPDMAKAAMMEKVRSSRTERRYSSAQMETAEVHEVGEYSLFESQSLVTIPARRSVIIPIFNQQIAEAKTVLHFKHENHPERPFRSVDFKNETDFSLGRGVCTIYEEATYSGSCIIPDMKPSQDRLLPHALETGVAVRREEANMHSKVISLHFSKGFCYTSTRQQCETIYHIKNNRNEQYQLILDHTFHLKEPKIVASVEEEQEKTPVSLKQVLAEAGRFSLTIMPKTELTLSIAEQAVDSSSINILPTYGHHSEIRIDWLEQNIVQSDGPLASDKNIQNCLKIHQNIVKIQQKIEMAESDASRLKERQDRIRKNIKAGGNDELTSSWRNDLDKIEKTIEQIEETEIPTLTAKQDQANAKLTNAIKMLAVEWIE